MNTFRFVIGIALLLISTNLVLGQTEAESEEEDKTLITIHAEDAFLPSILAILPKESG